VIRVQICVDGSNQKTDLNPNISIGHKMSKSMRKNITIFKINSKQHNQHKTSMHMKWSLMQKMSGENISVRGEWQRFFVPGHPVKFPDKNPIHQF